jgi:RNA polymerase sigma factor (sigma-70 family)
MIDRFTNRLKIDNNLTPASFDSLLAVLGPDREAAAMAYLEIRRALYMFFAARGAVNPDEMADETLNRVARRLNEGAQITAENPSSYFYAVARNVWREKRADASVFLSLPDDDQSYATHATPYDLMVGADEQAVEEARREFLANCLEQFPLEERELVISYYKFSGGEKIENRKNLAERHKLSNNTLRQKIARLRSKLAECIGRRMRARQKP